MADDDQCILVIDPSDNDERVEIPLNEDGVTVQLGTLEHAFPGAYGLKYKNPATGAKRVVPFDEAGKQFIAPPGGWSGKTFEIVFRTVESKDARGGGNGDDASKIEQKPAATKRKTNEFVGEEGEGLVDVSGGVGRGRESGDESETARSGSGGVGRGGKRAKMNSTAEAKLERGGKESADMIVMGLPYDLEEWALQEHFEQFGAVEFREIKRKKNGESRGFGFVRMASYVDQVRVLSHPQHIIGGRVCQVRISSSEKGVETYLSKAVESRPCPRLFVGGLNEKIDKERLKEFFTEHLQRFDKGAQIHDIYYPRPFRGFAFLTVSSPAGAKELVRQNDFIIDGQPCAVTMAVPKRAEEDSMAHQQQQQQQQPWAIPRGGAPGGYSGYGPPPVEMYPPEPRWAGGGGGNGMGGRGGAPVSRYDEYTTAGRGAQPVHYYEPQNHYPMGYSVDRAEEIRLEQTERSGRMNEVWMGGGGVSGNSMGNGGNGNIPPGQAEAILRQLPNDAVGTALKMLQSIMAGKQQQQENGQQQGEGGPGGMI